MERHEVASPENLTKRFLHPEVGLLKLNYTHLWLGQRLGTRMTTYTPADEQTDARLRELHDRSHEPVMNVRGDRSSSRSNPGILAATPVHRHAGPGHTPDHCEGMPMGSQTRWGLTLPLQGLPVAQQQELVASLPDLGYTDVWSAERTATAFTC